MSCWEEWEAGEGYKAKGQQEATTNFPAFPILPPVLDATRTLTLFLALAASFSKSQCLSVLHFPPIKLTVEVLIHQAVLEGYCIGGEMTVDLIFKSSRIFSG